MQKNKTENRSEENKLFQALLDTGEKLLASGAEVNRVEDTLERLGIAYGAKQMSVFVITSNIIITMEKQDGSLMTHTRRVRFDGSTNFTVLEKLNALSRECCRTPLPLEEFCDKVNSCTLTKPQREMYLGSLLAAGCFALFFGGSVGDGVTAAIFGLLICWMQQKGSNLFRNNIMFNLACSFVTGILICLSVKMIPVLHMDKIMIGDIMLLIPGIAMTNAIRDMLMGDTISGLMRLIESLLWAGALACGFMTAIWIVRI